MKRARLVKAELSSSAGATVDRREKVQSSYTLASGQERPLTLCTRSSRLSDPRVSSEVRHMLVILVWYHQVVLIWFACLCMSMVSTSEKHEWKNRSLVIVNHESDSSSRLHHRTHFLRRQGFGDASNLQSQLVSHGGFLRPAFSIVTHLRSVPSAYILIERPIGV
ncbi:hypothetical protein KL910_001283 [Ogataea haglerorum]|nr:hypothetical protein KL945_003761 [Ogataea haglerorum]KAG7791902.1 hypothetical protein KL910_001283 [Ogataea haglerorum]